ncbi:MAG: NusG domain II-containing protein, partial [Firmicutes bacterium]|nr:NusG domain II-containing protein [Bacillota bacterium]
MTKTDRLVLFLLAALGLAAFLPSLSGASHGSAVQVEISGRVVEEFPLPSPESPPRKVIVPLPRGRAVLSVEKGGVRILPMPSDLCPLGICSHSGPIDRPGESLVCVPNRLVVRIIGGDAGIVHAVAR